MVKNSAGFLLALDRAHIPLRTLRLPKPLRAYGMSFFEPSILFSHGEFCQLSNDEKKYNINPDSAVEMAMVEVE